MRPDSVSAGAIALPSEEMPESGDSVPDYFQEEGETAQRAQVEWLQQRLGMSDSFFAKFLRTDESSLRDWRVQQSALPEDRQGDLRRLWRTVLHLLSFMNLDEQRIKTLLEHHASHKLSRDRTHPLAPPWSGSSLKSYLKEQGPAVLDDVDRWVTAFRFGNVQSIREVPPNARSIFISFSFEDEKFARVLFEKLREQNPQVWLTPGGFSHGEKLNDKTALAIQACDRMLLVLSEHSMSSKWIKDELLMARRIQNEEGVRRLVPIRLVDYELIRRWRCRVRTLGANRPGFSGDLAADVRSFQILDFSNWENAEAFQTGFDSLVKVLSPAH
jgi:DNA-binding transcriptional regulator YiaG